MRGACVKCRQKGVEDMISEKAAQVMMKSFALRVLGRVAIPVTVGASLYSAARTVRAEIRKRKFEEENLRPLREESARWTEAISSLEGAAAELSWHESVPFPHTRHSPAKGVRLEVPVEPRRGTTPVGSEEMVIVHRPDPAGARDLVIAARDQLSTARDRRKVNTRRRLKTLAERLDLIVREEMGDIDFEPLKKRVSAIVDGMKKVRSDYEYRLSKIGNEYAGSRDRWAMTVAGLTILSALGVGSLAKRA
jgi:hypothetical protein